MQKLISNSKLFYQTLDGVGHSRPLNEIEQTVRNSHKFIVGEELFYLDKHDFNKALSSVLNLEDPIETILKNNDILKIKILPLANIWKTYAKMPYDICFFENSTGGLLVEKIKDDIRFTLISKNGGIHYVSGYIKEYFFDVNSPYVCSASEEVSRSLIKTKAYLKWKATLGMMLYTFGLVVCNILTFINLKNINITKYALSNKELKDRNIPKVWKEKYTYNIVDIFDRTIKYNTFSDVLIKASKQSTEPMRSHMVRGHFKRTKNGLYWWNAFLRCKSSKNFVDKLYTLKT